MWRRVACFLPALTSAGLMGAGLAQADTVVATRNLPARHVIAEEDVTVTAQQTLGAARELAAVIGFETRGAVYQGRPVLQADIGPPAVVERNALVTLEYRAGSLTIRTEGRALGRGAQGEMIRVMNLNSRNTVSGWVTASGVVTLGDQP